MKNMYRLPIPLAFSNLKIPKVKCFDKNVLIKMNNGEKKKIVDIQVGDILENNNKVTATFKVDTEGSAMLKLCSGDNNNIIDLNIDRLQQLIINDVIKTACQIKPNAGGKSGW
jgi:hypothetical protein